VGVHSGWLTGAEQAEIRAVEVSATSLACRATVVLTPFRYAFIGGGNRYRTRGDTPRIALWVGGQ
jgi:hypothetical protein